MLNVNNLTLVRGQAILAKNITTRLEAGKILVLAGLNGSGKTSFLRALAGLLNPASGAIDKPDFLWLSAQAVPPSLETPREYLAFHAALAGAKAADHDPFNIEAVLDTPFNKLSTGWRQRVKLTRLLQNHKTLWLLDEPSDGLDAQGIQTLQFLIGQHIKNNGMVVIATHQPQLWPSAQTMSFGDAA